MDTMTKADPHAATRALLALAQEQWERRRDEADRDRAEQVSAALKSGMTLQQVAEAMGLSIARVSQIRDTR